MELIDNISTLLGDDLKRTLTPGARMKIAASCFSIYAFEALKEELERIDSLEFLFTSPTFVPSDVTDKFRKERREFHIPRAERERSFYGTEFEIQLKNKLTPKAIASLPIAQETIDGKTVVIVDQDALAACFDTGVTEELVKKLAARKPLRGVFRDAGFSSDDVKINVKQIFKLLSPATEVKPI